MKYDCIVVISIVLLVIPCTGKIYPVPYKVEGEKIFFTRCYVEVKEVPFSKDDSRDKFLLDYLHALKVKDPDLANSFYEPEYRLGTEDEKLIKRWKEEPTPEIDTILKYSFNGYDVYYVGTRHGGTYSPCRLQGVDNARFLAFDPTRTTPQPLLGPR